MNKEELILIHNLLVQIKDEIEHMVGTSSTFDSYIKLKTSLLLTRQTKEQHTQAIFCLGKCIADAFSELYPDGKNQFEKTSKKFNKLI